MQFKAPGDKPVHIALVTGHTAVIDVEFGELDARFHREAIAHGCIPFGTAVEEPAAKGATFDRRQVIIDAINAMLDGAAEGDFTGDGKPDLRKLSARVGFGVDRSERDSLFAEVTK
jgi:hypothetical protein